MQILTTLNRVRLLPIALILLVVICAENVLADPTARKISIRFAESPVQICNRINVGVIPGGTSQGQEQRNYIKQLFDQIYPEIVAVYGEPLLSHPGGLTITIYYANQDNPQTHEIEGSSMYLNHKTEIAGSVLLGVIGALEIIDAHPCTDAVNIPDHTIFLHRLPLIDHSDPHKRDKAFDHLFTHELIHAFHDRMEFLGWYSHSWVEEGMTEAATELVAERLLRGGGPYARDLIVDGINGNAFDNLKHYDMWNYPYNGAWGGDAPSRNALPALQWFYAGLTSTGFKPGDDISFVNPAVIPTKIRYAAAASLWFLLAKACSTDATYPDFFVRLNQQLLLDDVTSINDEKMIALIEKVAPGAQVEGRPVREWLMQQAFLKGAPRNDGRGTVFIDVRNPENFQANDSKVNITAYAVYSLNLEDPGDLLGGLNGAELPMKGCGLTLKIIDAAGRVRFSAPMREEMKTRLCWFPESSDSWLCQTGTGKYIFDGAIVDVNGKPAFEEGSYIVQVTAGICNRLNLGTFTSVVPGGVTTATYALRGKNISSTSARHYFNGEYSQIRMDNGEEALAVGAALTPWASSSGLSLQTVGAVTKAFLSDWPESSATELPTTDTSGKFTIGNTDDYRFKPFELTLGQRLPDGSKNQRQLFVPYPYRRVAWLDVTPDFLINSQQEDIWVEPGKTAEVTALLIPNGVSHIANNGFTCPIWIGVTSAVPGVNFTMEGGSASASYSLSTNAPNPTPAKITINAGADAQPGSYKVTVKSTGETGNTCGGLVRSGSFRIVVAKSLKLSLNAVKVSGSTSSPVAATIKVKTSTGESEETTPTTLTPRQFTDVTLTADPSQLLVNGQWFDFVNWELNNDPNQRISANPLKQRVEKDLVVTARYLKRETISLTVSATSSFSSTNVLIPVNVTYNWTTGPGTSTGNGRGVPPQPSGSSGSGTQTTVFEIAPARNAYVTLDAPPIVKVGDKYYQFVSWGGNGLTVSKTRLTYQAASNAAFTAYYRLVTQTYYEMVAKHSGKCLDIEGGVSATANGAKLQQWTCSGTANQQWQFIPTGDGYYQILARHSGKALDVMGGVGSSGNGIKVQQWDYVGGANQQWLVTAVRDGSYKITSRLSGKALDIEGGLGAVGDGAKAQQWDYVGGDNQKWVIKQLYYELVAKHSGKCLDVEGGAGATANGAKVQQWTCAGTANQQWQFIPTGGGYYRILARHSGKALDVMGGVGSSGNGIKVQQWDYVGGANQQWLVTAVGDGSYKITSRHSGKALDIEGGPGAVGNGAKAQQWDYLGGNNQRWVIRLVAPFPSN